MNAESIIKVVLKQFAKEDLTHFGETYDSMTDELLPPLIDLVRDMVSQVEKDTKTVQAMWLVRAALASMAQRLARAMEFLWECNRNRKTPRNRATASKKQKLQNLSEQVLAMAMAELDRQGLLSQEWDAGSGTVDSGPALAKLIRRVVAIQAARYTKKSDLVQLRGAVSAALSEIAGLLARASAALWQAASAKRPAVDTSDPVIARRRQASPAEAKVYFDALKQFMATIRQLNIDPKTLPAGIEAVEEADALVESNKFLTERYLELRKWTSPETHIDEDRSSHPQQCADRGDQLIVFFYRLAGGAAQTPYNWSWRGDDTAENILGDILNALHHAADALGLDWEQSVRLGEWHYEDELVNPYG